MDGGAAMLPQRFPCLAILRARRPFPRDREIGSCNLARLGWRVIGGMRMHVLDTSSIESTWCHASVSPSSWSGYEEEEEEEEEEDEEEEGVIGNTHILYVHTYSMFLSRLSQKAFRENGNNREMKPLSSPHQRW